MTPAGLVVERRETFEHPRCETTSGLRIRNLGNEFRAWPHTFALG